MIVYPKNWSSIGHPTVEDFNRVMEDVLSGIDCNSLCFSGGVDSGLMLYYLLRVRGEAKVYTIGFSEEHPDVLYSRLLVESFRRDGLRLDHEVYIPSEGRIRSTRELGGSPGDECVILLYRYLESLGVPQIIACDGADEFSCGYYDHQKCLDYATYYKFIRGLQEFHLRPLDRNSGRVKVFLPYLDPRVISLFSQLALSEKVDNTNRKKFVYEVARGKLPEEILSRRKLGFCSALEEVRCDS